MTPGLLAAESASPHPRVELLPYPKSPSVGVDLSFEDLSSIADGLDSVLGHYPPKFSGSDERLATYEKWSRACVAADRIRAVEGDSERVFVVQAKILRQGHCLDVRECGERALTLIEAGLRKYPDSIPMNLQASYFYLQINPKYAPKGEKTLLHLRKLLRTEKNLEVERGLVFAYIYQNKVKQAQKQVDHCLLIAPDDEFLLKAREGLKAGKIRTSPRPSAAGR